MATFRQHQLGRRNAGDPDRVGTRLSVVLRVVVGVRRGRHQLAVDAVRVLGPHVAVRARLQEPRPLRRHTHATAEPMYPGRDNYNIISYDDYQQPYYHHLR